MSRMGNNLAVEAPIANSADLTIGAADDVDDVVARLEADGWKASEVMANAYPQLVDGEGEA